MLHHSGILYGQPAEQYRDAGEIPDVRSFPNVSQ
jgi:hypothetical protein